jgi:hypothetical protein
MTTPERTNPVTDEAVDPARTAPLPCLSEILGRVVVSVTTAALAPAALFWATLVLFNFATAVITAMAWMVAAMGWRWATARPVSGLLVLALLVLTIRTTLGLATGSAFFYFIQPVFADIVVAAVFLGSLWSASPIIARLAPDFYPLDAGIIARPRMRGLFRHLTLMWGLVILVKAALTYVLLESLTTADFVLVKGAAIAVLTIVAALVTICWAVTIGRREGLLSTS